MRYGSVCSGIEAATMAWHPIGWKPAFFSEIEKFPSAVLAHHYPHVPNLGDMTKFQEWPNEPIDLLVGGTPCQSFSVAGLRAGLADPRGNLALTYLAIAAKYQPRWVLWENVPGVFSSLSHDAPDPCPPPDPVDLECDGQEVGTEDEYDADETHAFGTFLAGLSELGYGLAYRTLDAQFCRAHGYEWAVPQRRRRVFVVGYLGDWRRAAAVLFDAAGLRGDFAPRREAGQRVAPTISARPTGGGGLGTDFDLDGGLVAKTLVSGGHSNNPLDENLIAFDTTQITSPISRANPKPGDPCHTLSKGAHAPAIAFGWQNSASQGDSASDEIAPTLDKSKTPAVAWSIMPQNSGKDFKARVVDVAQPVMAGGPVGGNQGGDYIQEAWAVRRLTPRECERLQGFPDDFTLIPYRGKPAADGPRYKALGNSMAVNVMRVLGERIAMVDALQSQEAAA